MSCSSCSAITNTIIIIIIIIIFISGPEPRTHNSAKTKIPNLLNSKFTEKTALTSRPKFSSRQRTRSSSRAQGRRSCSASLTRGLSSRWSSSGWRMVGLWRTRRSRSASTTSGTGPCPCFRQTQLTQEFIRARSGCELEARRSRERPKSPSLVSHQKFIWQDG